MPASASNSSRPSVPHPGIGQLFPPFARSPASASSGLITASRAPSDIWYRWRYKPRLALNTYCRPFLVPPHFLGIWCPEGRTIRFTCFDPDQLKAFDLAEVAGWFKQSADRVYAVTAPVADLEIPVTLPPGTHKIDVPAELKTVDELILPTSYKAMANDDPAFALFVLYLQAGLVEVLPQKWFTAAHYQVGPQWIPRAARDVESHRIFGECFGVGTFLLEEDGCRLAEWVEEKS